MAFIKEMKDYHVLVIAVAIKKKTKNGAGAIYWKCRCIVLRPIVISYFDKNCFALIINKLEQKKEEDPVWNF